MGEHNAQPLTTHLSPMYAHGFFTIEFVCLGGLAMIYLRSEMAK
jgi:hypothetical protein